MSRNNEDITNDRCQPTGHSSSRALQISSGVSRPTASSASPDPAVIDLTDSANQTPAIIGSHDRINANPTNEMSVDSVYVETGDLDGNCLEDMDISNFDKFDGEDEVELPSRLTASRTYMYVGCTDEESVVRGVQSHTPSSERVSVLESVDSRTVLPGPGTHCEKKYSGQISGANKGDTSLHTKSLVRRSLVALVKPISEVQEGKDEQHCTSTSQKLSSHQATVVSLSELQTSLLWQSHPVVKVKVRYVCTTCKFVCFGAVQIFSHSSGSVCLFTCRESL